MRFFKDILFTDTFLIKGHVNAGGQRLSTFLNNARKRFLDVEEATLIKHDGSGRITAAWVQVQVDDILFAHELEGSGDEGLKLLAERERDNIEIAARFGGIPCLQISGKVRKHFLDSDTPRVHDFIVIMEPRFEGLVIPPEPEYAVFENLPYAIVNRNRLALIFRGTAESGKS
jgi:hypothetical protein